MHSHDISADQLRPKRRFRTALTKLRINGARSAVAAARANFSSTATFVRWELRTRDRTAKATGAPPELLVRRGTPAELHEFRKRQVGPGSEDFYVDDLYGVDRFYLGIWDSQIAHISWVFTHGSPLVALEHREVEVRHSRTLAHYRGHRIFTFVLGVIVNDMRMQNVERVFAHVVAHNRTSHRAFMSQGFEPVGVTEFRVFLGRSSYRFRPASEPEIWKVIERTVAAPG